MSQTAELTIKTEQVDMLSVIGRLDVAGLGQLQRQLDLLFDGGARFLVTDLSQVVGCDRRLFDVLTRASNLVERRGGWLRLVGMGPSVLDSLDEAALPEILLVYRASTGFVASVEPGRARRVNSSPRSPRRPAMPVSRLGTP